MTMSPVAPSRLPVGSSAKISAGRATKARAIATRCCSPPESCAGIMAEAMAEPDPAQAPPRARAKASRSPADSSGTATFSSAVIVGIRWKA